MSSNEIAISARQLRGEICNFTEITGVKSLTSKGGVDIINVAEGLHEQLIKFTQILSDVSERMSTVENRLNKGDFTSKQSDSKDLVERLARIETAIADGSLRGPAGEDGADGRDGLRGPAGERGPRGFVEKLQDIKDVDLNGVTDGAILVYRKNKWVVEVPEE